MKRISQSIVTLVLLVFFGTGAWAADEFGSRFGASAPKALADDVLASDEIKALQGIEPAAGDEPVYGPFQNDQTPAASDAAAPTEDNRPSE